MHITASKKQIVSLDASYTIKMYNFGKSHKPMDGVLASKMTHFYPVKLNIMFCLKPGDFYRPLTEIETPAQISQEELKLILPTCTKFHPV